MALASAAAANAALDGVGEVAAFVSLHTATTGINGAAEEAGLGYIRQAVTWDPAGSSVMVNTDALEFTTPGTVAITHFGLWSAEAAGTFHIGGALTAPVTAATITFAAGSISLGAA